MKKNISKNTATIVRFWVHNKATIMLLIVEGMLFDDV